MEWFNQTQTQTQPRDDDLMFANLTVIHYVNIVKNFTYRIAKLWHQDVNNV